ncbi:hypothetical protein K8I61_16105 [bacterium]|nr:hypothetical protein [bacterium]
MLPSIRHFTARFVRLVLVLALAAAVFAIASCEEEGEGEPEDESLAVCRGNERPQIVKLWIIKKIGDEIHAFPPGSVFEVNETIGIGMDYRDDDCNLAGGKIFAAVDPQAIDDYKPAAYIPSIVACQGAVSEDPDQFILGFNIRLTEGEHRVFVGLEDVCGARTEGADSVLLTIVP